MDNYFSVSGNLNEEELFYTSKIEYFSNIEENNMPEKLLFEQLENQPKGVHYNEERNNQCIAEKNFSKLHHGYEVQDINSTNESTSESRRKTRGKPAKDIEDKNFSTPKDYDYYEKHTKNLENECIDIYTNSSESYEGCDGNE